MAKQRPAPQRSFGIFAEGSTYTDLRGRKPFEELWSELCGRVSAPPVPTIHVFGISKAQIVALKDDVGEKKPDREPLDLLIRRMHERHGFDIAVVAFDRIPQNQHVPSDCLRQEVSFVLERMKERALLPEVFREEAERLLNYYRLHRKTPRGPGRPPRGCLDIIYMDPMFEGLFACDELTVRQALIPSGLPKSKRSLWPAFDMNARYPDRDILGRAVPLAEAEVRAQVRGDMKSNKHGWALYILRKALDDAALLRHPIADRLRTILA